jgi:hypothetical protein
MDMERVSTSGKVVGVSMKSPAVERMKSWIVGACGRTCSESMLRGAQGGDRRVPAGGLPGGPPGTGVLPGTGGLLAAGRGERGP